MTIVEKSYSKDELDTIFAKGTPIPGKPESEWRTDACGHQIARSKYGTNEVHGWQVDHAYPDRGHVMSNLRPLQSSANQRKQDKTPEEFGC